ncbi:glycosyltransferase family 9 protein [Pedobacter sp. KLB.chiD]|uniref:glycosyltransferase family 9 protein n=1 Tax=Pedobacter sp. KLB.chiD TaxID=3387402 RepID=UPI0039996205
MEWKSCKRILVMRPDHMGDLLMSAPAIRALRESFECEITLLTSTMAAEAAALLPWIKNVICYDFPWLKTNDAIAPDVLVDLVSTIRKHAFDGCILFNVSSQNPAPSLMIAFMAGIPLRAAYCRENIYGLLTHWLPDPEPYFEIRHQVARDLKLCASIGAQTTDQRIRISVHEDAANDKLKVLGLKKNGFFIFHMGVSEEKRQFPKKEWIKMAKVVAEKYGLPILLSGNSKERENIETFAKELGKAVIPIAGLFNLKEFAACVLMARAILSVNTGPMHLAAAVGTPVLALYARTNPQHTPWMVPCRIIEFDVLSSQGSNNQVLRFQSEKAYPSAIAFPSTQMISDAFDDLLRETAAV